MKKSISLLATLAMTFVLTSAMSVNANVQTPMEKCVDYTVEDLLSDGAEFGDEWHVLSVARSGLESPDNANFLQTYYENALADLTEKEGIYTDLKGNESLNDYVRVAMTLTSMGEDITDFGGYNLLDKIISLDFDAYEDSSTSTLSYTLILADFYKSDIDYYNSFTDSIISEIMTRYLDETGFTFALGEWATVEPDTTAQAIQGLMPYYNSNEQVKSAIDNSVQYLKSQQSDLDGAITSWGSSNPSSTAQTITALTILEEYPIDFSTNNGKNLMDGLLGFQHKNGGFWDPYYGAENGADYYATGQAVQALVAEYRISNGQTNIFDFSDIDFNFQDSTETSTQIQSEPIINDENSPDTGEPPLIITLMLTTLCAFGVIIVTRFRIK